MRPFHNAVRGRRASLSLITATAALALAACLCGSAPAWSACQTTTQVVPPATSFTNTGCISTTNINAVAAGPGSTVINDVPGIISITTSGFSTAGINASGNGNTLTNNGSMSLTAQGGLPSLISATGNANTVTNNGTMTVTISSTSDGAAITVGSSGTATNNGSISLNGTTTVTPSGTPGISNFNEAFGLNSLVLLGNPAATLINNGSISSVASVAATAMSCDSAGCSATNAAGGSITLNGTLSRGIDTTNSLSSVTLTNNGSMTLTGTNSVGISSAFGGFNNTILNAGSITMSGANSIGIQTGDCNGASCFNAGTGTNITNSGTVHVTGAGSYGFAIVTQPLPDSLIMIVGQPLSPTGNTFVNSGMLIAGPGAIALGDIAQVHGLENQHPSGNSVVNTGTIDGQIVLSQGTMESLTNSGLITISYPGSGITHSVNGTFTQTAAGTLALRVDANGGNDKLFVTGTAILGGTVAVLAQMGNYPLSTKYTIVTATGGVVGTFAKVTSNLAFLTPSLTYDADDVFLTLTRNTTMFSSIALTRNQRAVAAALDQSPIMSPLVLAVLFQSKAGALQAFDALSGEIHASVQTAMIDDSQYMRQAVLGRLRSAGYAGATGGTAPLAFGGPDTTGAADGAFDHVDPAPAMAYGPMVTKAPVLKAPAPYDSDWTFWAQGVGAWGRWNTDGNAATMDRSLGGAFVGTDRRFGDTWRLGFASGFTQSDLHVDARLSSADVQTVHVAGYAGARFGAFDLRTGAAAAWSAIETSRSIMFPGFLETAQANYHGATAQAFGEVGYGMAVGNVAVEPFAGAAWVHLETNAFTETGSLGGVAPLAGAADEENVAYTTLGVRAATSYQLANGMFVIPRATVAWQHAFGDITPVAALAFQSTGVPFTVAGVPLARNAAVVDAGLDVKVTPRATLGIFYAGQLADNVQDHAVKGKFCWRF
jgi:outer membrane autotransporter protein